METETAWKSPRESVSKSIIPYFKHIVNKKETLKSVN